MTQGQTPYPVQLSVDYPEKPLDRLSTFFRLIALIPIAIILALVSGQWQDQDTAFLIAGGALVFPPLLLILFRQKYRGGGSTSTWRW